MKRPVLELSRKLQHCHNGLKRPRYDVHTSRIVCRSTSAAPQSTRAEPPRREQLEQLLRDEPPQVVLRKLFERLGATYVKLGQFIASSPSLFPAEYVLEFQKCLDKTDPVDWAIIKNTIESELGRSVNQVFSYIDPVPLASASIAQVHCAVLRDSQKEVVIKVLKPGVEDVLISDLNFLQISSQILEFLNPQLARTSLAGIVTDIRASMLDETDFRKEAAHIAEFSDYLDLTGMRSTATCPFVYKPFSTKRMMTMDKLDGVPLTDLDAIRSMTTANPEQVLIGALNTWSGSLVACPHFHADVHAGNLLVMRDGRIGFIDFGIVGSIAPSTWTALQALIDSTSTSDFSTMARAMATLGVTKQAVDIQGLASDLEILFKEIEGIDAEVLMGSPAPGTRVNSVSVSADDSQVNRLLLKVVELGENYGIRFPREFGLLLKQFLYFDRYTRILAPTMSVLQDERVNLGRNRASAAAATSV
ncbi:hypothetical protein WJX73_004259 [Symbiochloris irregularis]|uniref:ABC1 atypical kinase-like domain-containing protein n=1 Tax=Symbiochloris irregularis TaxID=706552 RepID=A0AAW1P2R3_9CHLO